MAEGQMTQSTYQQIDACPGRIDALETSKADATTLTEETAARTAADAKHLAALVELVDSGAKNKLEITASSTTTNGVQITINADGTVTADGTAQDKKATGNIYFQLGNVDVSSGDAIHISGCPSGGSYSNSYAFYIDYAGGSTLAYDEGSGASYTANADRTLRCRIIIRSGTVINNLTFKPMVCTEAAWKISHAFFPYCPPLPELYAMIQGGTRSLQRNVLTTQEETTEERTETQTERTEDETR